MVSDSHKRHIADHLSFQHRGNDRTVDDRWFEESAEPERFTIKTASAVVDGQGIYAAIIVEKRNPLAKAIVDDFELTAQMLTEDK